MTWEAASGYPLDKESRFDSCLPFTGAGMSCKEVLPYVFNTVLSLERAGPAR